MQSVIMNKLKLEGNNMDEYLNRFEQDEETCEMLLSLFFSEMSLTKYLDAYGKKDYTAAHEYIHDIKGTSSNVGLTLISGTAKAIMLALEELHTEKIDSLNDDLISYFETSRKIVMD